MLGVFEQLAHSCRYDYLCHAHSCLFVLKDPSTSQSSSEERLNHETLELEKRLSMLSHRSSTGRSLSLRTSQEC